MARDKSKKVVAEPAKKQKPKREFKKYTAADIEAKAPASLGAWLTGGVVTLAIAGMVFSNSLSNEDTHSRLDEINKTADAMQANSNQEVDNLKSIPTVDKGKEYIAEADKVGAHIADVQNQYLDKGIEVISIEGESNENLTELSKTTSAYYTDHMKTNGEFNPQLSWMPLAFNPQGADKLPTSEMKWKYQKAQYSSGQEVQMSWLLVGDDGTIYSWVTGVYDVDSHQMVSMRKALTDNGLDMQSKFNNTNNEFGSDSRDK